MRSLLISFIVLISFNLFAESEPVALVTVSGDVIGFELSGKGLTLQVASGGCLTKDDFSVKVTKSLPPQISIVQTGRDFCDAYLPYGKKLTFSYAELNIIENTPVQVDVETFLVVRAIR